MYQVSASEPATTGRAVGITMGSRHGRATAHVPRSKAWQRLGISCNGEDLHVVPLLRHGDQAPGPPGPPPVIRQEGVAPLQRPRAQVHPDAAGILRRVARVRVFVIVAGFVGVVVVVGSGVAVPMVGLQARRWPVSIGCLEAPFPGPSSSLQGDPDGEPRVLRPRFPRRPREDGVQSLAPDPARRLAYRTRGAPVGRRAARRSPCSSSGTCGWAGVLGGPRGGR